MAKETEPLGVFTRTDREAPKDNSDLDEGRIRPSGVGLREGEIAALDAIGARYDLSRNTLLRLAARMLILQYRTGKLDLSSLIEEKPKIKQPKRRVKMPSK